MEVILKEVEGALAAKLYYAAVSMALTLPDICASLASKSGNTTGRGGVAYRDWYEANLASKFPYMTGLDCYSLRCGIQHQGKFGGHKLQYSRVVFNISTNGLVIHNNVINDALNLDTETFCREVVEAVRIWYSRNIEDQYVSKNIGNLVQYRKHGIPPFIVGIPVIS